jgi:hypothetical protein
MRDPRAGIVMGVCSLLTLAFANGCRQASPVASPPPPSQATIREPEPEPTGPGAWARDSIFQRIVQEVQAIRGLTLSKPLKATPLDDDAFDEAFLAQTKRYNGDGTADVDPRGTLGFYDYRTAEIFVREELPAWSRSQENPLGVLAHEIVHALQHEHHPALLEPSPGRPADEQRAISALIEGDAEVTRAVFEALAEKRPPKRWVAQQFLQGSRDSDDVDGESPVYAQMPAGPREALLFPYRRGGAFVAEFYVSGGFDLVNQLYEKPPLASAQILHPGLYLFGQRPIPVRPIQPPADLSPQGHPGAVGELGLRLIFRELKLPRAPAMALAASWRGDYFLNLGRSFFRAPRFLWVIVFADEARAAQAERIFHGDITVVRRGATIALEAGVGLRERATFLRSAFDLPGTPPPPEPPLALRRFAPLPTTLESENTVVGRREGDRWSVPALGVSFVIPAGFTCHSGRSHGVVATCTDGAATFLLAFSTLAGNEVGQRNYRLGMGRGLGGTVDFSPTEAHPLKTSFGEATANEARFPKKGLDAQFTTAAICRGRALLASFHAAPLDQREASPAASLFASMNADGLERSEVCARVEHDATHDLP